MKALRHRSLLPVRLSDELPRCWAPRCWHVCEVCEQPAKRANPILNRISLPIGQGDLLQHLHQVFLAFKELRGWR